MTNFAAHARPKFPAPGRHCRNPGQKTKQMALRNLQRKPAFFWFLLAIGVLWLLIVNTGWTSVAGRLR